jgi:hypothetical protein
LSVARTLESARRLARQFDFSIIPIREKGKLPSVPWKKYQAERASETDFFRWFATGSRNLGIVTGEISNIVVVDLDSFEAAEFARANLPQTPMRVISARGEHWYYRHPGTTVRNKARIADGVDVRGDGGFVVGPGSKHQSGRVYKAPEPWPLSLAAVPVFDPAWLQRDARAASKPAPPPRRERRTDDASVAKRIRRYLEETPPAIQGQGGDNHTFQVCCRLVRGFNLSDYDALECLRDWNARCSPPWTESELIEKIEGARKYGDEPIGGRLESSPLSTGPPHRQAPDSKPNVHDLRSTIATFRRWLHLEDLAPLLAVSAALVANKAPGDPVWLLLVCAPSTGKTEILSAATKLPWVVSAAEVTKASLLSASSKRDRVKHATGGLLRQIGDFGVLLCKDFTSVLAQNRDARAEGMAALREVADGSWVRLVGTDGGLKLEWRGKCGFLGGVTPALDQYGQVTSSLGDRFVLLRMGDANVERFGEAALRHGDKEQQMRQELADALAGLVEHADVTRVNRHLQQGERDRLIRLAAYTARARTAVIRDGYRQDVQYLPQVEGPGRLVKAFARLLGGFEAIGCSSPDAWEFLTRIAIDCAPALRTKLIRELVARPTMVRTSDIAGAVGVVTRTAHRLLEDLEIINLAEHAKSGDADNSPDLWSASDWLKTHWPEPQSQSATEMYLPAHRTHLSVGGGNGHGADQTVPFSSTLKLDLGDGERI